MALWLGPNVAALIAAAILVAHLVFKALQGGRSYHQLLEEVADAEAAEEPQQQWRIPLALTALFYLLIIAECLLLAHREPTWGELGKAAIGISYSFYQANLAPWKPKTLTRVLVSLPLNIWMLAFPFLQCQWWLFGVSTATCTVCAVLLHLGDFSDVSGRLAQYCMPYTYTDTIFGTYISFPFSFFSGSLIAAWLAARAMVGTLGLLFTVSFTVCASSIVVLTFVPSPPLRESYGSCHLIQFLCWVAASGGFTFAVIAVYIGVLQSASTLALSLGLTLPAIPGLLQVPLVLTRLEVRHPENDFGDVAVVWIYLVWSILLPLLTFTICFFAVAEVAAIFNAAWGIAYLAHRWSNQEEVPLPLVLQYGILRPFVTVLPLGVVWWSGEMPLLLETVQPWMFSFVPVTLGVIYVLAEVDQQTFGRSDIVARLLVLLVLLATPWALALDTAELQQWAPALDMDPADFVTLKFGPNETWKDIKTWHFPNTTWHSPKQEFLRMPRPTWPKLANMNGMLARANFWIPFMATKLLGAIFLAILVLGAPCRKDRFSVETAVV